MKRTLVSILVAVMMMITAVGMTSVTVEAAGKKTTTKMKTKLMTQLKTTGTTIINLNHWFISFQSNL